MFMAAEGRSVQRERLTLSAEVGLSFLSDVSKDIRHRKQVNTVNYWGWPKSSFTFFHKMLQKNLNKLFQD